MASLQHIKSHMRGNSSAWIQQAQGIEPEELAQTKMYISGPGQQLQPDNPV